MYMTFAKFALYKKDIFYKYNIKSIILINKWIENEKKKFAVSIDNIGCFSVGVSTIQCIVEARQSPSTRWRDTSLASHLVAKRQRRRGGRVVVGALAAGGRRSKRIACQSFKTFSRHTLLPVSL